MRWHFYFEEFNIYDIPKFSFFHSLLRVDESNGKFKSVAHFHNRYENNYYPWLMFIDYSHLCRMEIDTRPSRKNFENNLSMSRGGNSSIKWHGNINISIEFFKFSAAIFYITQWNYNSTKPLKAITRLISWLLTNYFRLSFPSRIHLTEIIHRHSIFLADILANL